MFAYVVGALVGAALMGKTKPKTRMVTMQCFGPRTGTIYTAEVMPGENVVVLHAPDQTMALFEKGPTGQFRLLRGLRGYEDTVKAMQRDLEP